MIAALALALALAAQPNWRCTYRGFNTQAKVTSEFRREASKLVDQWDLSYRIVEDDADGIAATSSSAFRGRIEASTIVINKRTGAFNRATITAPAGGTPQEAMGRCVAF